ncbi:MAG: ATP-binding cassette domain-containing protein [Clostridiaceae bacterium]|nr:ATP-binding cassette domain-containing protein [Clostridiaceae bacterium]
MNIKTQTCGELLASYRWIADFFTENHLDLETAKNQTMSDYLASIADEQLEDLALDRDKVLSDFITFVTQMRELLGETAANRVDKLSILPGLNKEGEPEGFDRIDLYPSEIISIVGPTGSGKSRLLQDIEWTASGDTPTRRRILINDEVPDLKWRFSANNKLVAQLSQNMNFVMDLTCYDFLSLHAQSRLVQDAESVIQRILEAANELAGEPFSPHTHVTALSGGQSRALMIADTAILSTSPIVLIDEIENAGIDRRKALNLLLSKEKIVLMATHDPTLALIADRRLIISKGGIANVLDTTDAERRVLSELEIYDLKVQTLRRKLRYGERVDSL